MASPRPSVPVPDATEVDADACLRQLRESLARHGIVLPSLSVELPCSHLPHVRPLIELGRCNLRTAHALSYALAGPHDGGGSQR